jgi:hypothetical protein
LKFLQKAVKKSNATTPKTKILNYLFGKGKEEGAEEARAFLAPR